MTLLRRAPGSASPARRNAPPRHARLARRHDADRERMRAVEVGVRMTRRRHGQAPMDAPHDRSPMRTPHQAEADPRDRARCPPTADRTSARQYRRPSNHRDGTVQGPRQTRLLYRAQLEQLGDALRTQNTPPRRDAVISSSICRAAAHRRTGRTRGSSPAHQFETTTMRSGWTSAHDALEWPPGRMERGAFGARRTGWALCEAAGRLPQMRGEDARVLHRSAGFATAPDSFAGTGCNITTARPDRSEQAVADDAVRRAVPRT